MFFGLGIVSGREVLSSIYSLNAINLIYIYKLLFPKCDAFSSKTKIYQTVRYKYRRLYSIADFSIYPMRNLIILYAQFAETTTAPTNKGCSPNQATCMNGDCISKAQICNGEYDCNDGSDEQGCSREGRCEPNEFKCTTGKCILKTWRCDGDNDCFDGSDEQNCPTANGACRFDEFQCGNGQCIPKSYQCDKHPDCHDTSDENGCSRPTVTQTPQPYIRQQPGSSLNISCRAVGVPVPLVTWRLNWGHVPSKCSMTSVDGFGVLTCPNLEVRDSGAYSCEVINSEGTVFVTPDTILTVDHDDTVCAVGTFNSEASRSDECINCFCFGMSTQCSSAELYTYKVCILHIR